MEITHVQYGYVEFAFPQIQCQHNNLVLLGIIHTVSVLKSTIVSSFTVCQYFMCVAHGKQ